MTDLEFSQLKEGDPILIYSNLKELEDKASDSPGIDPARQMIRIAEAREEIVVQRHHPLRNWVFAANYWWPPEWVESSVAVNEYPAPSFDDLF